VSRGCRAAVLPARSRLAGLGSAGTATAACGQRAPGLARSAPCCYCACVALSKRPGSLSLGFGLSHALDDKLLRDKHTVNVRAYLSRIAAWHVDKFEFPLHAHGVYHDLPGRSPVMGAAGRRDPQHFHRVRTASGPLCTRHPHVVHTKPVTAQWPPRSVAGRSGRAGTARATARHPVLRGSTPMAWRRLADVAAATQPKRGSDDPKVSDSIRTNGPYLTSEGSRSGYQPL
jgi:hypothetical protein